MDGRRNTSALDELAALSSRLPSWVSVLLALLTGLLLHLWARGPAHPPPGGDAMVLQGLQSIGRTLASVLQYVVPGFILLSQGLNLRRRQRDRQRMSDALSNPAADSVATMDWYDFLQVMVHAYRLRGWHVTWLGGPDDLPGADLALRRDGEHHVVDCQHWRARRVGVAAVRKLREAMEMHDAQGGWLVTSGQFTAEAQRVAASSGIRLVDGPGLSRVFEKVAPVVLAEAA